MIPLSTGIFLLTGVILLIYLGLLQGILHRMYLSPRGATFIIIAMIIGSYLPPIPINRGLMVNIGGMLIPLALVVYILIKSHSTVEQVRTVVVSLLVAIIIYATDRVLPVEPGFLGYDIDPIFLPGIVAALLAYLFGRSRRAAFCGAILGVLFVDLFTVRVNRVLGGAGLFDVLVLSGIVAVLLTEGFGELLERIKRPSRR